MIEELMSDVSRSIVPTVGESMETSENIEPPSQVKQRVEALQEALKRAETSDCGKPSMESFIETNQGRTRRIRLDSSVQELGVHIWGASRKRSKQRPLRVKLLCNNLRTI
ncbi:hypothetical protein OSTOST_13045 [Ostertagia ostertagi]